MATKANDQTQLADKTALQKCKTDVFISGGGPVGLMLAIALSQSGKSVVLAEQHLPQEDKKALDKVQNSFDGRVLAISKGAQSFLQQISVWPELSKYTNSIEHIHVSQKGYLGITTLHAEEVGVEALGYAIQSSDLGAVLWRTARQQANLTILCPAVLDSFEQTHDKVLVQVAGAKGDKLAHVEAKLIVGADGTHSKVRTLANLPIEEKSYDAFGVLAQIETELHPQGWAYERFTEEGPVALLPMNDHFHKAVMVCPAEKLDAITSLSDEDYMQLFAEKMGERLGRFTQVSPRVAYPLKETYAPVMTVGRVLLMGNASHTQHPVAAQGLNLGIRDIEVFIDMLQSCDDAGNKRLLQAYAEQREGDHQKVMGMTDTLIQVFQHKSPLVGHLRGIGLMAMQAMPSLKNRFSKFAMRGKRV